MPAAAGQLRVTGSPSGTLPFQPARAEGPQGIALSILDGMFGPASLLLGSPKEVQMNPDWLKREGACGVQPRPRNLGGSDCSSSLPPPPHFSAGPLTPAPSALVRRLVVGPLIFRCFRDTSLGHPGPRRDAPAHGPSPAELFRPPSLGGRHPGLPGGFRGPPGWPGPPCQEAEREGELGLKA